jgi:hypothetical protein
MIKLIITQEFSKGGKDGNDTIFYIRETKHIPGRTFEATALTRDSALWQIKQLSKDQYESIW